MSKKRNGKRGGRDWRIEPYYNGKHKCNKHWDLGIGKYGKDRLHTELRCEGKKQCIEAIGYHD